MKDILDLNDNGFSNMGMETKYLEIFIFNLLEKESYKDEMRVEREREGERKGEWVNQSVG